MAEGSVFNSAYKGDFNQVRVRIEQNQVGITEVDENDRMLIHWAALGGHEIIVEYLLDEGSPVDPTDDTKVTPLILAASAGRYSIVRFLIARGADVNKKSVRGQSALQYACSKGYADIAKLLLDNGADVNNRDILGATPLHRAAAQGRSEIVDTLLKCDCIKIDATDVTGSTPLFLACEEDRHSVAAQLVTAGANPEIKNTEEKTPFDLSSPQLKKLLSEIVS